jgi:hypothetical protein
MRGRARLLAALAPWGALLAVATNAAATPAEAGIRRQIVAAARC